MILSISKNSLYQIMFGAIVLVILLLELPLELTQIFLCVVFFECVLISFTDRFFNVYQIFLLMLFLFNLSIPIFNTFGLYQYSDGYMFMYNSGIKTVITRDTLNLTFKVLIVFMLGSSIGWLCSRNNTTIHNISKYYGSNIIESVLLKNKRKIRIMFMILMPIELVYEIILVRYSMEAGYVATMHLHSYGGIAARGLSLVDYLYPFAGYSLLYCCRDKDSFFKNGILFLLPYAVQVFTGLRGNFVAIFMTFLFVYSWNFRQIRVREIVSLFGLMFLLISGVGAFRFSHSLNDLMGQSSGNIFDYIINEICSNGASIVVLSYTIQFKNAFWNKIPFLFGYIDAIFSFADNYTYNGLLNKSYLAQHVTYLLNPNRLYGGSTIGTAITAEFFELTQGNLLLIFLLSILLMYFANLFIRKMYNNLLWFYFSMSYLHNLFLSPRGSVMKIFNKISIVYILIYFIIRLFINGRRKKL